ncbi:phosphomethylethanolamine N-methyltransferase-like [Penaeus chinensis]|uniref:phosphomethylethanolamine N-methyltransferase-like n=1 Tax=Penaeus chinensis TaxID=139456 RepID=UPI001FB6ED7A|nr:phosphomethylethanolamine N-methyltransferase-like [Penaeus chinensis]
MAATVQEEKLRLKMKSYWQVYSPSLESMMLSNDAKYLAENEQNEVMSYLPPYQGKRVLELGAGIGRFTARLATVAGHVTAVDFMQEYIDKNKHDNKHMGNINFMCADVTKLDFPAGSFDLVFSNWLFMYLGDKETQAVFERCMKWLSPGGHFFVRESCYHQSGNVKRNENPTLYRTPLKYCHMLHSVTAGGKALFKILRGKSILTYIHYHGNPNQLCFLARRVDGEESDQLAHFLQREYSVVNILGRERAHGYMWWSTGGETTNRDFCARLNLRPGMRVLDVGCGTGGSAFYMARHYGVHVHGVDLSTNMIHIAIERQGKLEEPLKKRLQFEISDILTVDYEQETYDVIYSRDSIFHIPEKQKLFQHIYRWLRPGGVLFLTDFCSGPAIPSKEFLAYVDGAKRYSLAGKDFYVRELESAGFTDVASEDLNEDFMKTSKAELKAFTSAREAFISDFSEEDFAEISSTLANKIQWTQEGQISWRAFTAIIIFQYLAAHILHRTEPRRLNLPPCCQGSPEPALKLWDLATGVADSTYYVSPDSENMGFFLTLPLRRLDKKHIDCQYILIYIFFAGYDLRTVKAYGKVLEEAGFKDVQAVDMTQTFISVLQNELKYFEPTRDAFVKDYSEKDYKEIVDGWRQKLVRCNAGDQAWGMFLATR